MLAGLTHRGPDGGGIVGDAYALFGAARLSIRGHDDGQQPIIDRDTGVISVCNGEIDNHRELRLWLEERGRSVPSATDVAVIPGLYLETGEDFPKHLSGAFAIAVWDPRTNKLVLARDRAGERPLYYRSNDGIVSFASEIGALTAGSDDRLSLDRRALGSYLRYGCFTGDEAPFSEFRQVPPASTLTFDGGDGRRRRYWRWALGDVAKSRPEISDFESVFAQAVRRQSDVDVGYGVFLSGGVDSSLVAAFAKRVRPEKTPTAYTLRFEEDSFDEGKWARSVADKLGLPVVEVPVRAEEFPDALADMIAHCGQPLADPAWLPTSFLARRACEDIRIALVGEGADEMFGGYPTYLGARIAATYGRLPGPTRAAMRWAAERWPVSDKKVSLSFLAKKFVSAHHLDGLARHLEWVSQIPADTMRSLGVDAPDVALPEASGEILDVVQRHDFETSLAEGLMPKADRGAMRWAVETRAPFLDDKVMDFAATLPPEERVRGLRTKSFLKRFAEGYLPKEIVHRRKRGLSVPLSAWLRGPLQSWARDKLASPHLADFGLDQDAIVRLFDRHLRREEDNSRALWTLIVLSQWLDWNAGRSASRNAEARRVEVA